MIKTSPDVSTHPVVFHCSRREVEQSEVCPLEPEQTYESSVNATASAEDKHNPLDWCRWITTHLVQTSDLLVLMLPLLDQSSVLDTQLRRLRLGFLQLGADVGGYSLCGLSNHYRRFTGRIQPKWLKLHLNSTNGFIYPRATIISVLLTWCDVLLSKMK